MKFPRLLSGALAVSAVAAAAAAVFQTTPRAAVFARGGVQPIRVAQGLDVPERATAGADDDARIALVTTRLLAQEHYLKQKADDTISARLFDGFLEALDPQRLYFLQSDVEAFAPLRTTLDDRAWQKGDTSPAGQMFQRFLERFDANVGFVKGVLADETFSFTSDETYPTDRKKLPRPATLDEAKGLWRARLRYEYLQEKLNKKKPQEIVETLNRRYARLSKTLHDYDDDDRFELYLNSLARAYDPHSGYFGKASSENFDIRMRLSLVGVGAQLQAEDGYVKIMELTPGGPAIKSKKLKPGDRIVAVAQGAGEPVDVVDMKLDKVVEMIRGKKGTEVRLTIIPADAADPSTRRVVTLIRDEIRLEEQAAKAQIIDVPAANGKPAARVGVIDLPLFYRDPQKGKSATADVARLLYKLKREGVTGVVLDLRRNGGGALPEAIDLTGLFIRQGPVVQVRDGSGAVQVARDRNPAVAWGGPLVVLTSRFSASASEIVAGALQDYGRAVIVGDAASFGKGTVQAVIDLAPVLQQSGVKVAGNPGSLHLTIQKFYRPGGASTQLKGVASDVVLPSPSGVIDVGEHTLDNPLPWDAIPPSNFQKVAAGVRPHLAALRKRSEARVTADKGFAVLRQQIAQIKKAEAQKSVSLNEQQRLREKAEAEARAKARQAATKPDPREKIYPITLKDVATTGLPKPLAVTKLETANANLDPRRAADSSADPTPGDSAIDGPNQGGRDITLDESKRILLDLISMTK